MRGREARHTAPVSGEIVAGFCNCGHGYGQHQQPKGLVIRKGTVEFFETEGDVPNYCCGCDNCDGFIRRISRWALRTRKARAYCWMGEDEAPICGKEHDGRKLRPQGFDFSDTLSRNKRCKVCAELVKADGLDQRPRLTSDEKTASMAT